MNIKSSMSSTLRLVIAAAGVFIIILGMRAIPTVINVLFLAFIITICFIPILQGLRNKGMGDGLSFLITILILIVGTVALVLFLIYAFSRLATGIAEYGDGISTVSDSAADLAASLGVDIGESLSKTFEPAQIADFVGGITSSLINSTVNIVFMLLIAVFMLVGAKTIAKNTERELGADNPGLIRFGRFNYDIRKYVWITTLMGIITGSIDFVFLSIMGVEYALLWGVLAWVLSYIPSIGYFLALIPPMLMALVQFGPTEALIVFVGYFLINGSVEQFVKPKFMGDGLDLAPVVIVVSLFFWAFILGPIGALTSIPMTVLIIRLVLASSEQTSWLARVLSPTAVSAEPEAVLEE